MSQNSYDYATRSGLYPISWEDFHGICKALAVAVSRFQPDAILPIGRGGYYPGTLLAHLLQIEIYPFHPEYIEALTHQGVDAEPQMLIPASNIRLAKG